MREHLTATAKPEEVTTPREFIPAVLAMCVWFGIFAGLAERFLHRIFPRILGGNDLWFAALADLLFFSAVAVPILVIGIFGWRRHLQKIAFISCSSLLALDCLVAVSPPFGHRLGQMALLSGEALLGGFVATILFFRFPRPVLSFGRITLPPLGIYALLYLGGGAWWAHYQEKVETMALNPRQGSPNILLVIMDAVGANHLSTYGHGRLTSPHLTELASRGLLFEKAVAPSSWTLPSHASMLTGRLPSEHHAGQYHWRLDGHFPTLAEVLSKNGYRSAGFSGNTLMFNRRVGLARGYHHFEDGSLLQRLLQTSLGQRIHTRLQRANLIDDLVGRQDAREISQNALQWIRASTNPFFVTINYFDAHEPLLPPPEYFHRFSELQSPLPGQYKWPEDVRLSAVDAKHEADAYDAIIAFIDEQISELLKQLENEGRLQNTIVIVTSDHGQEFQEHEFMFHGKGLYWNLLHTPLVISWSGHVPAGARIAIPVALQSLPATLLTMAAIPEHSFPGPSMTDLWTNPSAAEDWPLPISELAEMGPPLFPSHYGAMKSAVTTQWHYVQGGKSGQALYACCDDEQREASFTRVGSQVASVFRQLLREKGRITPSRLGAELTKRDGKGLLQQKREYLHTGGAQKDSNREHMNDLLRALGYVP
jgi:arylsulfatase A-like enzyme